MKRREFKWLLVVMLCMGSGWAWAGSEGNSNTFYGTGAGNSLDGDDDYATFIGYQAGYHTTDGTGNPGKYNTFVGNRSGYSNTTGDHNTFLGLNAGFYNTTGRANVFIGDYAGRINSTGNDNTSLGSQAGSLNSTGSGNVFLGHTAGYYETGSNKLYIDNSSTSIPLIYGEFDNDKVTVNGNLEVIGPDQGLVRLSNVTTDNTNKVSRMVLRHYSNGHLPVYLFGAASTATDNFVAFGGGNTIGNAVTQIDLFTAPNTTTPVGTARITVKGNGYVGIGTQTPSAPLQMAGGAYTNGAGWFNASSREYKEDIESLTSEEALEAIRNLNPVKFAYKSDRSEKHVGFIAEDVPDLVATRDRKGLSPMDIVAVLTKVLQEQQALNTKLMKKLAQLEAKLEALQTGGVPLHVISHK